MLAEKVGKYELVERLASGSMGTVYSAHDPFTNRLVAIKVAHPQHAEHTTNARKFRKLFFNEAHAAGMLDHPNILQVFDADMDGDCCYLVMELVEDGDTLEPYCSPDRLLSVPEVVGIVYKTAKALDYAHRQGVIHRDIKPGNILLTQDRDVKLADFSVAMITRADAMQTQFIGVLGSPLYMSPEQFNEEAITGQSDIFSLGTVMYQLLTGSHPFQAESLFAINQKISSAEPRPLGEFRSDLPQELSYTLGRMLKKNPSERYASGLDLAADLAVIFEDLDAVADEDGLREKFATIKSLGFFKGFSDADIWELIRACAWQTYSPGQSIIREGDMDHSFYIVLSGVVIIEKEGSVVNVLQEGDCFGEMGYLSRARRIASAIARTDVSLMKVNDSTIDRAAEDTQLRFHRAFVRTLIERLTDATSLLSQLRRV
ncbi:MAG: protein kinase [Gammaproteobacteria bacterium]|nr:protein kinase [Gammaproteobacteria bacterium]NIM73802.1 protein kinase [Gammaproteobacteria bacterium]NIN39379.1 protein kinase [Gammaproteobacteria bacterium]NIO25044.1 protein kinase [Gammaproteobacteria bacterium]NIO65676.1 protein kinase [Gammaproteobacteria bacterium]